MFLLKFPALISEPWVCTDTSEHGQKLLATVTEGVFHSVYKVVAESCFDVIWRHRVSGP